MEIRRHNIKIAIYCARENENAMEDGRLRPGKNQGAYEYTSDRQVGSTLLLPGIFIAGRPKN